jgi:membrane protein YdbS with pleckstrin-like domain
VKGELVEELDTALETVSESSVEAAAVYLVLLAPIALVLGIAAARLTSAWWIGALAAVLAFVLLRAWIDPE